MYILLKIFNKKLTSSYEKPLLRLEVSGDNAVRLMMIKTVEHFYGSKNSDEVKKLIEQFISDVEKLRF